jgi:hypothetical protein
MFVSNNFKVLGVQLPKKSTPGWHLTAYRLLPI